MTESTRYDGKFYTPAPVAKQLVALISAEPSYILDLCSGPGALSAAALERWRPSSIVTIDKDPTVRPFFNGLDRLVHRHIVGDALQIDGSHGLGGDGFDVVLTNPPFGYRPRCDNLYQIVDRSIVGRGLRSVTAEMAALAQAFWFAKPGATVASIMPDTLVAGARAAWFRQQVEHVADVCAIKSLPPHTFHRTDAKTHLVVLRKHSSSAARDSNAEPGCFYSSSGNWLTSAAGTPERVGNTLADLGVQVVRGATNATKARAERRALFHTDGFAAAAEHGVLELNGHEPCPNEVEAVPGDILMARVHRNIEAKVALVARGTLPISDCVYRLRCPKSVTESVWRWLRSSDGRTRLSAAVRGVSARHLPKSELLNMIVG
ncbi:N-6 DNA methylase [Sphingobium sp. D43FB]|uniref:N-6 DNA methylase n=1 Tax=Sphingobium sp. D43FB TaxID=2017595 RepID=UPI001142B937|nr:N-6 DNA methylase [Sphingobium sp. D43FB]